MSWLTETAEAPSLDTLLARRPELATRYRAFYDSIRAAGTVPERLLELCRLRVAAIHGCAAEWDRHGADVAFTDDERAALRRGDFAPFTPAERAALAVTERIPFQHHALTDAEVAELKTHLGDAGCVALLNGLVLFDVECRLKLVFGVRA